MKNKRLSGRIHKYVDWYFSKRVAPYWLVVFMDLLILLLSSFVVYGFFVGFGTVRSEAFSLLMTFIVLAVPYVIGFRIFHTYTTLVRYSSFIDILQVCYAMIFGCVLALVFNWLLSLLPGDFFADVRIASILVSSVVAAVIMILMRVIVKSLYDMVYKAEDAPKAFIYGVYDGGVGLAKSIRNEKPSRFSIKGFITHDPQMGYAHLLGEKVYPVDDNLTEVLVKNNISAVLVAPNRNEVFRRDQKLQDLIIASGAKIYMAHNPDEWEPGKAPVLSPVNISDLLPREQISVDMDSIGTMLKGSRVLVTGSAGSIGSEIVRQVASFGPAEMMLLDQAETPQHDIRIMMARDFPDIKASAIVTSVCHSSRMDAIFNAFRPDYVFHAAAYKHVPMMEDNPPEAVLNNVYGTKVLADLSVKYGVRKFVMISTDKAVNPTNVMGCSKRLCEIYVQALNSAERAGKVEGSTEFVTTRFGNVLGSNGSVIPLFEEQIRNGGPVTVTDPNIVRFFMLIPEACKLVLEAGTHGDGGQILVFDMGEPVKISDLARRMIKLSGAENVEIVYTGLRDGEKLYEEVLSDKEDTLPSFHEKIRIAQVREYDFETIRVQMDELLAIAKTYDPMKTVAKMKEIVPEYVSNNSVYTILDKH